MIALKHAESEQRRPIGHSCVRRLGRILKIGHRLDIMIMKHNLEKGYFHICTDGNSIPWMFQDDEDFIKGMDVSSVLAEEASGVVYYNKNGEKQDLFQILERMLMMF